LIYYIVVVVVVVAAAAVVVIIIIIIILHLMCFTSYFSEIHFHITFPAVLKSPQEMSYKTFSKIF
jgi:hypothetical protein